jgi:hypothetical protein
MSASGLSAILFVENKRKKRNPPVRAMCPPPDTPLLGYHNHPTGTTNVTTTTRPSRVGKKVVDGGEEGIHRPFVGIIIRHHCGPAHRRCPAATRACLLGRGSRLPPWIRYNRTRSHTHRAALLLLCATVRSPRASHRGGGARGRAGVKELKAAAREGALGHAKEGAHGG